MTIRGALTILLVGALLLAAGTASGQLNISGSPPLPISLGGTSGTLGFGTVGVAGAFRIYDASATGTGSYCTLANALGTLTITCGNGSASTQNQVQLAAGLGPSTNDSQDNGSAAVAWRDMAFARNLNVNGNLGMSGTAPTVASGFGSGAAFDTGATAMSAVLNVGTTPGTTGVVGLPTAAHAWVCPVADLTSTTRGATVTSYGATSITITALTTWSNNDLIAIGPCAAH